jgi:hypothetical protein
MDEPVEFDDTSLRDVLFRHSFAFKYREQTSVTDDVLMDDMSGLMMLPRTDAHQTARLLGEVERANVTDDGRAMDDGVR